LEKESKRQNRIEDKTKEGQSWQEYNDAQIFWIAVTSLKLTWIGRFESYQKYLKCQNIPRITLDVGKLFRDQLANTTQIRRWWLVLVEPLWEKFSRFKVQS